MLYTVVPLERIYSCRTESVLGNTHSDGTGKAGVTDVEYKSITLQHGNIYARRDGENYIVEGVNSTDMNDYLNQEYTPGTVIKNQRQNS